GGHGHKRRTRFFLYKRFSVSTVRVCVLRVSAVLLAMAATTALAHAQLRRPRAEISPLVESPAARAGNSVRLALQVTLPEGLHTQSNKPRDPTLIPTVLTVDVAAGLTS